MTNTPPTLTGFYKLMLKMQAHYEELKKAFYGDPTADEELEKLKAAIDEATWLAKRASEKN